MGKREFDEEPAEICTFVVRIWLEQGGKHGWRGHITHTLSGKRIHFESVDVMDAFVVDKLEMMCAVGPGATDHSHHRQDGS